MIIYRTKKQLSEGTREFYESFLKILNVPYSDGMRVAHKDTETVILDPLFDTRITIKHDFNIFSSKAFSSFDLIKFNQLLIDYGFLSVFNITKQVRDNNCEYGISHRSTEEEFENEAYLWIRKDGKYMELYCAPGYNEVVNYANWYFKQMLEKDENRSKTTGLQKS